MVRLNVYFLFIPITFIRSFTGTLSVFLNKFLTLRIRLLTNLVKTFSLST